MFIVENHVSDPFNHLELALDDLVQLLEFNFRVGAFFNFFLSFGRFTTLLLKCQIDAVLEQVKVLFSQSHLLFLAV